jgi:hypothetical protein
MTEKENFMRVINGQEPAWVPRYDLGMPGTPPDPYAKYHIPVATVGYNNWGMKPDDKGGLVDILGVPYSATEDTGGMILPTPNIFILKDITKWRDVVKLPSLEGFDWEGQAKKALDALDADLKSKGLDRNMVATQLVDFPTSGYFLTLTSLMGMTEALCALLEEPEAVEELFTYINDFNLAIARNSIRYFKPDLLLVGDDTATATNPFMSRKTWQELIMPPHARMSRLALEAGVPVMMHCCGRCEDFIEDWADFGVTSWQPAQVMNDLDGIRKKYGNKMVFVGCWDSSGPASWIGASEEMVRQEVRNCIDRYAPGGGFMFWGDIAGSPKEEEFNNRRRWITEEYEAYREHPYK